jgi:hypothetical protein
MTKLRVPVLSFLLYGYLYYINKVRHWLCSLAWIEIQNCLKFLIRNQWILIQNHGPLLQLGYEYLVLCTTLIHVEWSLLLVFLHSIESHRIQFCIRHFSDWLSWSFDMLLLKKQVQWQIACIRIYVSGKYCACYVQFNSTSRNQLVLHLWTSRGNKHFQVERVNGFVELEQNILSYDQLHWGACYSWALWLQDWFASDLAIFQVNENQIFWSARFVLVYFCRQ